MIGTFGYLIGRAARNRVVRQLRRLRQPRYLVALALGLAYLWLLVFRQRPAPPPAGLVNAGWIAPAAAVAVALAMAWSWIFAGPRRALAFTPAEVTFLFPAPVSRRQLIHFKLLRNQVVILLNTVLWTLLLSQDRFGASAWFRAAGVWVLLTTLSLHRLGASFVRGSLAAHGRSAVRRRIVSLAVLATVLVGIGWVALEVRPMLVEGWRAGLGSFLRSLAAALERPATRALLAPFLLLVGPLQAGSWSGWLEAMGPALALLGLHYVWVIRSDVAFEEAALEHSLRRARVLAERTRGNPSPVPVRRASPPYRLRPGGAPAGAIVWKNLVAITRTGRPRAVALAVACGGLLLAVFSFRPDAAFPEIVGWLATMWAGFLLVVGPQWIRSDLRGDLPKLDLLRSYPLRGSAVVAAEVMSSTLVLSALQLGVLVVGYLAFLGNRTMEPDLAARSLGLAAAVVVLPAVNLLGLLIHNGAAILFPDWVAPSSGRSGGVEALGQNMLAIIAYLILLALALAGPVGIGVGVLVLLRGEVGWWAAVPAAVAGLAAVAAQSAMMIRWFGRIFERTDPAAVPAAG